MSSPKMVDVTSIDLVRIEVLGEGRYHSIPASVILHAFEHEFEPGTAQYLARSILQFADTLDEIKAMQGDTERCLRKIRMHIGGLLIDARIALGLPATKDE